MLAGAGAMSEPLNMRKDHPCKGRKAAPDDGRILRRLRLRDEALQAARSGETISQCQYVKLRTWALDEIKAGEFSGTVKEWLASKGIANPDYTRDYRATEKFVKVRDKFWSETVRPLAQDPSTRWIVAMLLHLGKQIDIRKVAF